MIFRTDVIGRITPESEVSTLTYFVEAEDETLALISTYLKVGVQTMHEVVEVTTKNMS